jgi:polar amino acid transport system substrate-binding protein
MKYYILVTALLLIAQGCERFPKDPDHTLEKVKNGILLVGYSENPPWVIKTENEPTGIEAELIKEFAKSLRANIRWINGTEQSLFESLEKNEIHLVIAGITKDTPWSKKGGLTRPYVEHQKKNRVMAVPLGENAFLVQLEKFLHKEKEQIKARIAANKLQL